MKPTITNYQLYKWSHHFRNNVLFSGAIYKGNQYDDRYELGDIFPDGFFNKNHYNKTHGAYVYAHQPIDVWGVFHDRLFAKTIVGDLFISRTLSTSFNTCVDIELIYKSKSKSGWCTLMKNVIDFTEEGHINHYYNKYQ